MRGPGLMKTLTLARDFSVGWWQRLRCERELSAIHKGMEPFGKQNALDARMVRNHPILE